MQTLIRKRTVGTVLAMFVSFLLLLAFQTPMMAQYSGCAAGQSLPPVSFQELEVDGQLRRYQLYLPPNYDPTQPTPVVVSFHGSGSNAIAHSMISA